MSVAAENNLPPTDQAILIGGVSTSEAVPYSWIDSCNQKLLGSSRHYLKNALSDLGYEAIYAEPARPTSPVMRKRFEDLVAGKYAMITGVYPNQASDEITLSKVPIIILEVGILFKNKKMKDVKSFDDLEGFKGNLSFYYGYLLNSQLSPDQYDALDLIKTRTFKEGLENLTNGKVDYIVTDRYRGLAKLQNKLDTNGYSFKAFDNVTITSHIAVKKGGPYEALLARLDEDLAGKRASGYFDHLQKNYLMKWLGDKKCVANTPGQLTSSVK